MMCRSMRFPREEIGNLSFGPKGSAPIGWLDRYVCQCVSALRTLHICMMTYMFMFCLCTVIVCPCARKAEKTPLWSCIALFARWAELLPKFIDSQFSRSSVPLWIELFGVAKVQVTVHRGLVRLGESLWDGLGGGKGNQVVFFISLLCYIHRPSHRKVALRCYAYDR